MATQLCQKCKQAHPGRACEYDEKGECAETQVESHVRSARQILKAPREKIGELPEIGAATTKLVMALNVRRSRLRR